MEEEMKGKRIEKVMQRMRKWGIDTGRDGKKVIR